MKTFLVVTQYEENYGAHDWDGKGECPQYWKRKGGEEYIVTAPSLDIAVEAVEAKLSNSEYSREYVLGSKEVEADYTTDFENSQYEYEGTVRYPANRFQVEA